MNTITKVVNTVGSQIRQNLSVYTLRHINHATLLLRIMLEGKPKEKGKDRITVVMGNDELVLMEITMWALSSDWAMDRHLMDMKVMIYSQHFIELISIRCLF